MVKRKNKTARLKTRSDSISNTTTIINNISDSGSDIEEIEVVARKTARKSDPMEDMLQQYHSNPGDLANLTVGQCIDLLVFASKIEDRKLTQKYSSLLESISANLRKMTEPIQNQNAQNLGKIFSELTNINNNIVNLKQEVEKINSRINTTTITQTATSNKTYAQIIQTQAPRQKTQDYKTIIIKSTIPNQVQPKIIESKIKKIISDTKSNAKITKITTNKSAVVIHSVENNQENFDKLIKNLNEHSSNGNQFKAFTPKKLDPTIVIKNVSIDNNITTIIPQLINNNPQLQNQDKNIKFLFKMKSFNPKNMNLVFRVSPETFRIINDQMNNFVFIDFQRCQVEHKVLVRQCQKCFLFNHKTADCKNSPVCKHCSSPKDTNHKCANEQQKCCSNCKNSKLHKNDTNHHPNSDQCPIYRTQITRLIERTQYFPPN